MSIQQVSPQLAYVRWLHHASTRYVLLREEVFETRARETIAKEARQFLETLSIIFDKPRLQMVQSESTWIGPITDSPVERFHTFKLGMRMAEDVIDWTKAKQAWIEDIS